MFKLSIGELFFISQNMCEEALISNMNNNEVKVLSINKIIYYLHNKKANKIL